MKASPAKAPVNGVPVDQLEQTIDTIREQPDVAKFTFRASNRWLERARNRAVVTGFRGACEEHSHAERRVIEMDEPPVLLGEGQGTNPVEVLLCALSGCITTTLAYHAAARGVELKSVESTYEGDIDLHGFLGLDPSVRPGYSGIRVRLRVESDAPDEVIDELVELAGNRSPVADVTRHGTVLEVVRDR